MKNQISVGMQKKKPSKAKAGNKETREGKYERAKAYALRLLAYRSRSKQELMQRLQTKGFSAKVAHQVAVRLEALNLIDDEVLAQEVVREAVEKRPRSKAAVAYHLRRLGIGEEVISRAVEVITPEVELNMACQILSKALGLQASPNTVTKPQVKRAISRLQARGFSYGLVQEALSKHGLRWED